MSLLLSPPPPPPPEPVKRNKTGVANLIKSKAPAGQQTLEWWVNWLRTNWG